MTDRPITIGFTGTQTGLTHPQKSGVRGLVTFIKPSSVVHGDCIGGDSDFHEIIESINEVQDRLHNHIHITLRPSDIPHKRAYSLADYAYYPEPPLIRNDKIASDLNVLIAGPKEFQEVRRSGTWATIRYTRKKHKEIYIVFPDGSIRFEMTACSVCGLPRRYCGCTFLLLGFNAKGERIPRTPGEAFKPGKRSWDVEVACLEGEFQKNGGNK